MIRRIIAWPVVLLLDLLLWCIGDNAWRALRAESKRLQTLHIAATRH